MGEFDGGDIFGVGRQRNGGMMGEAIEGTAASTKTLQV